LSSSKIILVLGGVRSGKSRFGQDLARKLGGDDVLFVATAECQDEEMALRIARHRQDRPTKWQTQEQPLGVADAIGKTAMSGSVVLLDCLTLLISNLLLHHHGNFTTAEAAVRLEVASLIDAAKRRDATLVIVSGEVGMGVVPESSLGRQFRDLLGWANQSIAQQATATYLMVAGLPVNVSCLASSLEQAATELNVSVSERASE